MKIIVDSCTVINLFNSRALDTVCGLKRCRLMLSPLVVGECEPSCAAELVQLRADGKLEFLDDNGIDADVFLSLLDQYRLGDGETECIAVAMVSPDYTICCDDRRARTVATKKVGAMRVIGSLRLLKWAVEEALINCEKAFGMFEEMKLRGGFLPPTERTFFCNDKP